TFPSRVAAASPSLVLAVVLASTSPFACGSSGTSGDAGTNADAPATSGDAGSVAGTASCTLTEVADAAGGTTLQICQEIVSGATAAALASLRHACVSPTAGTAAGLQAHAQSR